MAAGLRVGIEAPTPRAPRVGLLTSANVIVETEEDGGLRIGGGVAYEPEACGTERTGATGLCSTSPKTIGDGEAVSQWDPFLIWAGDSCSTLGSSARDWQGRARRKLAACESRLIESELWLGTIAQSEDNNSSKWLASADSDVVTATALPPADAVAFMDAAIAGCSCGQGFVHVYAGFIAEANDRGVLRREGNLWLSPRDNIYVEGTGYDGSGPAGEAAAEGSRWIYATGPVTVRLGPVDVVPRNLSEATDRSLNRADFRAERMALYHWDCCHLAAEIDSAFPAPSVGGPGS